MAPTITRLASARVRVMKSILSGQELYAKAELHALEDRQASVAIDQVDQASMVNVDVVAADALGPCRHVRHPPGGLLHLQGIGDIDHPEPVGEPGGGDLVADDGFDGLMARRHQWRLDSWHRIWNERSIGASIVSV